jgi:hypothetical protein
VAAIVAALRGEYFLLPARSLEGSKAVVGVLVSGVLFAVVLAWLLLRIVSADLPGLRAVEVLAVILPLFVYVSQASLVEGDHTAH